MTHGRPVLARVQRGFGAIGCVVVIVLGPDIVVMEGGPTRQSWQQGCVCGAEERLADYWCRETWLAN